MTKDEVKKALTIVSTAYPTFTRGKSKSELSLIVDLWSAQFMDIPYEIMVIALNKLISTNTFAPSISEVRQKIKDIRYEAIGELCTDISKEQAEAMRAIVKATDNLTKEPSLLALTTERRQSLEAQNIDKGYLPTL